MTLLSSSVQATLHRKVLNEVCTWEKSPCAASCCPFTQRSNKAFRRPASSSRRASVAQIAGLLPAFSDVFAVFLSKDSAVQTCLFFFFPSQLSDWTISRVHTERGGGCGAGRRRLRPPPTRFHLKECSIKSTPKTRRSLHAVSTG